MKSEGNLTEVWGIENRAMPQDFGKESHEEVLRCLAADYQSSWEISDRVLIYLVYKLKGSGLKCLEELFRTKLRESKATSTAAQLIDVEVLDSLILKHNLELNEQEDMLLRDVTESLEDSEEIEVWYVLGETVNEISMNILKEHIRSMVHDVEVIPQRNEIGDLEIFEELRRVHEFVHIVEVIGAFSLTCETAQDLNVLLGSEAVIALD